MKDSQILSTFQELPLPHQAPAAQPRRSALVFDACSVGVVLRAVLFVEAVVATGAMFGSSSVLEWVQRTAMLTGGALPATLSWLVAACSLKNLLARLADRAQYVAGAALGALAGLYGCLVLRLVGFVDPAPWLACAFGGALLASLLVAALVLRARGRTPAATAARLSELQSRIRPHFLFNTLNSAIALVRAEPAKAEALLEDLSDLFRHALVDHGESVTLREEITLAQRYLAIEQVRFGERLQVEWAQVKVSTQRRGAMVVVKVTNTVPAGQGQRGHGVALANVRDRLRLLHDVQGQFQTVLKDGVYQVRMEIPA